MRRFLLLLCLAVLLTSCKTEAPSPEKGTDSEDPDASHETGIDWHTGDVNGAFELARNEGMPLFLYWGAIWCPPCNQVKATVFTRDDFIATSQRFIPVYLDGDTDRAQIWGEHFAVQGYPTMIVFDSEGEEITRIPGGIDVEAFAGVLDTAIDRMRPVKDLFRAAAEGSEELTAADYKLLAYHSWFQDQNPGLPEKERLAEFRKLFEGTPEELGPEKARLFLLYLAQSSGSEDQGRVQEADRQAYAGRLQAILDDNSLVRATLDSLLYYAEDILESVAPEGSAQRAELAASWSEVMKAAAADESLTTDERLSAHVPRIELYELQHPDEDLPQELSAQVAADVARADRVTEDLHERMAVISTAAYLLRRTGRIDEAREMLEAELERSQSPYYFMSSLSGLARKEGDTDQAIAWLKKAWDSSEGPATRFQWGTAYLVGLLDMTPEEGPTIQVEAEKLLGELTSFEDAFYGRNQRRLDRLEKAFSEWNEAGQHEAEISAVLAALSFACEALPMDGERQEARERCEAFLS